jgi:hypothetical protein
MTATVTLLPRLPRGIDRTAAYECIRHTATLEINGHITPDEADRRIARHADKTLTVEARNEAYEQLKDALRRLSCLQMPGGGRDANAELAADYDAHNAVKRLAGPKPSTTGGHR